MGLLLRQIAILVRKDLLLLFSGPKSRLSTLIRALWIPIIYSLYMSVIIKVYWPKEKYGVGNLHQLLSLQYAMKTATGGRDTVVFVNNVSLGGDIDRVINNIATPIRASAKMQSFSTIHRIYFSTGGAVSLPSTVNEYPFTSVTQKACTARITTDIQRATTNHLSVVWYIGFVGIMYQLVGLMAKEREIGMSDLVESMMPNVRRWECQFARLIGHFLAFSIVYAPGWIVMGVIAKHGLFLKTSGSIVVIFFILSGLALISFSILGASFFRKAQLSGITTVVLALCLGIIAQIESKSLDSATVVILGLLFTPMTFVFFLSAALRFGFNQEAAKLGESAPGTPWTLHIGVLWALLVMQIIAYPILSMYVERWLYGTAAQRSKRNVSWGGIESSTPVRLTNFKKIYQKSGIVRFAARMFGIRLTPVIAINDLSLTALQGQILALVGANGCGKTSALNAIAGLNSITDGSITVDGSGGIGLCPQQNVLWNGLTIEQHAKIFHKLKTTSAATSNDEVCGLIKKCGLEGKRKSRARTLSGGQKSKLQLIMMLIGGSRVCCLDEVSEGLDPPSWRRIWDILLAERGHRTFILTTHFLDEAEYLADHISIITKGHLKAEGSTSELKARLGSGYRVLVSPGTDGDANGNLAELSRKNEDQNVQVSRDQEFPITGPTIEEVFMKMAIDTSDDSGTDKVEHIEILHDGHHEKIATDIDATDETALLTGHRIGAFQQIFTLFRKRVTVLRRSWVGTFATIVIPIAGAGLVSMLIKNFRNPGCNFADQISVSDIETLSMSLTPQIVIGPQSALTLQKLELFSRVLPNITQGINKSAIIQGIHVVNSLDEFLNFTNSNYSTIVPGGIFLGAQGSVPTYSYRSNLGVLGVYAAIFIQNAMNVLLSNQTIATQYGLAAYPAFFTLYPTAESLRGVRALQYSNGVRSLPLWSAYLTFDGVIVLFISVIVTLIFATAAPHAWFSLGTIFLCLFLYGITSILLSYVISLVARSQLSAFAFSAGGQAGSPPVKATTPGPLPLFGAPIIYLICQSLSLFGILVWSDHGFSFPSFRAGSVEIDFEDTSTKEPEVSDEINRVAKSDDGLRVLHTSKTLKTRASGKTKVVDDLTFGIKRGEVFALVGPNGAGKSTTNSMIRGEIKPDHGNGQIFVENTPVAKDRDAARSHLGVCPQHDPLDKMTVLEHLCFYAGIRGLSDIEQNVDNLVKAVGLAPFRDRMASKLSGGNKRKLGNPDVLLLDEPSSGMDPLAKRSMWTTLSRFVPHRSILLTTHSMEDADALASRVDILARHMLDLGTTQHLRAKHGYGFHVHLVLKSAPTTGLDEMENLKEWVEGKFKGSEM
ncbi:P-loop containing nucleoside triphosphate hydrolase protein [Mollisia scopiformis]|uniref:p-loop containing nucleoside triphosphate hydrolase protein n=1 Tax=Mollisia scopiformis TaxID=149040 RepID=A0A194XEZ6_MOLSC|nr:P-loop containing nucleoside triphosphate hydrolase protein [Mollisia scopiformis]KUJ18709.1 P-loop containing nucleoside triphosphate hydrolase protein [Mollisia scopiformis]